MKVINNVTETVRDDLSETLRKGSRLSIAAACFSIYALEGPFLHLLQCQPEPAGQLLLRQRHQRDDH